MNDLQKTTSDNREDPRASGGGGRLDVGTHERLMEAVVCSTVDAIIVIDNAGKVVLENQA